METTRITRHSPVRFPSDVVDPFSCKSRVRIGDFKFSEKPRRVLSRLSTRFADSGHPQYYVSRIKEFKEKEKENNSEIKLVKKKLKLIKRMSYDLSLFSLETSGKDRGNSLMDKENISEAVELLQAQLQQLRSEQKELKRTMKEKKAEIKTALKQSKGKRKSESSSSSSSQSSDSENGKVIDMIRLKSNVIKQSRKIGAEREIRQGTSNTCSSLIPQEKSEETLEIGDLCSPNNSQACCRRTEGECSSSSSCDGIVEGISAKRIEICMGGKCKKLGAEALLQEFDKRLGSEFAVSGCKCMGKCKDGPNLRVVNNPNEDQATRMPRPSINSLCIGVGLDDVDVILANILPKGSNNNYFLAPS